MSPLHRRDWLTALGLALLLVIIGYCQMVVGVCGIYHDDAVYVSTAKSLAEGQGYRLINLPDSPLQTKYPILYPALLALIWKLWPAFPDNLLVMQWLTLLTSGVTIALAYLYLIRFHYFSRGVAAAACLLCITAPFFLYFCGLTLSEMPFAFLFILLLWTLDRHMADPDKRRSRQFLLGVILALPFLSRSIGAVFVPIGLALLISYGRPWRLATLGATSIMLPWTLWMVYGPKWHDSALAAYYTNYLSWWSSFVIPHVSGMVFLNTLWTFMGSVFIGLGIFNSDYYFPVRAWPVSVLFGSVGFIGLISHLRSRRVLPCLLIGYLLVVLVWPWPPLRFLIPVLPFLLAYLLNSVWKLLAKIPSIGLLATCAIIALLAVNLSIVSQTVNISKTTGYPFFKPLKEPVAWSSYENVFLWIRENTEAVDVIASGLDTMLYLYTGRRGFRPFFANPMSMFYGQNGPPLGTVEEMMRFIKAYDARYFVQLPMPGFSEEKPLFEFVKHVQEKYPGLLKPVYVGEDSRFVVFKFQSAREPSLAQSKGDQKFR